MSLFYLQSAALPKKFIVFFRQLIIIQNTTILCKKGQNRYPTLPKCPFGYKKMREILLISLKFVVPLAGLEPARGLPRGILRHMRQKQPLFRTTKIKAFSAENRLKTPQNQTFYLFKPNLSVCYKILKISNFPKLPNSFHKNEPYLTALFVLLS